MSPSMEMLSAMVANGFTPRKDIDIDSDGRLVRFQVEGDKPGSKNGWAVLHARQGPAWGAYGSWRTGEQHTWHARMNRPLTTAEQTERRRQQQQAREQHATEQATVHANARERAARLWAIAGPATDAHPYLQRKRVHAYGIRRLRDMLMIPARDAHGTLHTAQFIGGDGTKRFMTGGRIAGCYYAIGRPVDKLLLAEGYATAATLHEATGAAVAVCFHCGNLEAVALAIRDKFPSLDLVVCADNDHQTPGNPGLRAAKAAARRVQGLVAVPTFEAAR